MKEAQQLRLYGHRGACAELPENTIVSFERAVQLGANALETDVHMSADGHIVVSHDASGSRAAGTTKHIRESSWSEIRTWDAGRGYVDGSGQRPFCEQGIRIPLLSELLDAFDDVRINIDIKQRRPAMVEPLLKLLRDAGAEQRVTLGSFHTDTIHEVRARGFRGETAFARDEVVALALLPLAVYRGLSLSRGDAVQVPTRAGPIDLASPRFIKKCHALGLRVDYWTVNDPVEAEVLLSRGADGIMTDSPAAMVDVFARHRAWLGLPRRH